MVYIETTRYQDAYNRLQRGAQGGGTTVLVFVSMDTDALCALRILNSLFKRDTIGHKIIPVNNYSDITSKNQQLIENSQQIKTVVLINCGGQVDVQDYITLRDDLCVIIIDSHRPFNLYNVYWNDQVLCFDDGDVEKNMGDLKQAFEEIEFAPDDSDDSEAELDDEEDDSTVGDEDNDGKLATSSRKRGSDALLSDDDDEDDLNIENMSVDGNNANKPTNRKRKTGMDPEEFIRIQNARNMRRKQRTEYQQLIQAYYNQGSYYGQSCAITMLHLAEILGQPATQDLVWWAIVGATSQFLLQQIDSDGYSVVVRYMRDMVGRVTIGPSSSSSSSSSGFSVPASNSSLSAANGTRSLSTNGGVSDNPNSSSSQALLDSQLGLPGGLGGRDETQQQQQPNGHVRENIDVFNPYLDVIEEEDDEGYLRARAGVSTSAEAGLLVSSKQVNQRANIHANEELKFVLLRHWSLDSAMRYSPYVSTRLATWSTKGRARLDLLLAKLGLSKAEAREPFVHLAPELKKQLYARMAEIGPDYDMEDARYSGFVREYGWRKSSVSAADMVLSILALLQHGRNGSPTLVNGESNSVLQQSHVTTDGFYAAYDALAQYDVLRNGIEMAQELQRLIVSQGVTMLERRAVKTLRAFRLVMLGDIDGGNSNAFSNVFALRQLALFLMQTLRERSKSSHARLPFVIAAPIASSSGVEDMLLVLGITPLDYSIVKSTADNKFSGSLYSGESRNHFGLVFEEVAGQLNATVKQGFFDTSVLEIKRTDMSAFADRLRRHL